MGTVYESPQKLLRGDVNFRISSAAAHYNLLFLGTQKGSIRVYLYKHPTQYSANSIFSVFALYDDASTASGSAERPGSLHFLRECRKVCGVSKPIQAMKVVPEWQAICCICNGQLCAVRLPENPEIPHQDLKYSVPSDVVKYGLEAAMVRKTKKFMHRSQHSQNVCVFCFLSVKHLLILYW